MSQQLYFSNWTEIEPNENSDSSLCHLKLMWISHLYEILFWLQPGGDAFSGLIDFVHTAATFVSTLLLKRNVMGIPSYYCKNELFSLIWRLNFIFGCHFTLAVGDFVWNMWINICLFVILTTYSPMQEMFFSLCVCLDCQEDTQRILEALMNI